MSELDPASPFVLSVQEAVGLTHPDSFSIAVKSRGYSPYGLALRLQERFAANGLAVVPKEAGWSLERAGPDHCPAAKHHRVTTTQKGSRILEWREDERGDPYPVVEDDTLESDRCIACGYDFQARALLAPAPPADHE